jgi:hypothetical protein
MGTCLSTVLPRRVLNTPRRGSREGSIHYPRDEGNTPKDEGNAHPSKGEGSRHVPKDEGNAHMKDEGSIHLPNDVNNKTEGAATKRRALLVGIVYSSPSNTYSQLDGPHSDVDRYRELLICA